MQFWIMNDDLIQLISLKTSMVIIAWGLQWWSWAHTNWGAGLGRLGFESRSWVKEVCLNREFLFLIFEFGWAVLIKNLNFVFLFWAKWCYFRADLTKIKHISKMMCHLTAKSNRKGRIDNETKLWGIKSNLWNFGV